MMAVTQQEVERPRLLQQHPYLGLVIAIAVIVAAVWLLNGGTDEAPAASNAVTLMTGRPGGTPPRIGQPAPQFTVETLAGGTISLSELRGRPVLVNFWASWCPPCRGEMPDLENLAQEYREAGLVVVAVNLQEDRAAVQRYAEALGLTFTLGIDPPGAVSNRYNLTGLPTSYFIDRDGVIRDINIGALTARGLRNKLAKVL